MYRSIRNINMPPPGRHREFDSKPSPGSMEFDEPCLTWGGEFDKGEEF